MADHTFTQLVDGRLTFDASSPVSKDRMRLRTVGTTSSVDLNVTTDVDVWSGRVRYVEVALKLRLEHPEGEEGDLVEFGIADAFDQDNAERLERIADLLGSLDLSNPTTAEGTAWGTTLREALAIARREA